MATTIEQAPPATRARFTPATWTLLAAESVIAAGVLHLVVDVQNLDADLLFAVLFLGVGPLQVLFGALVTRGVRPVVAVLALLGAVGIAVLYVHARTTAVPAPPTTAGTRATDLPGTVLLACELVAVGGLGALLPSGIRRWTTKGLLGIGVAFWLLWFWLTLL